MQSMTKNEDCQIQTTIHTRVNLSWVCHNWHVMTTEGCYSRCSPLRRRVKAGEWRSPWESARGRERTGTEAGR